MPSGVDEVEWLDEEPPPNQSPRRPPPRSWYFLAGAAAIAVVLVLTLTRFQTKRVAAPTPTPTPSPSASTPPVSLIELGRSPLNVPPTWVLVARGFDAVYEIQLATGRTTRTSAWVGSSEAVWLIVGQQEVIVRPQACVDGYLIRDGQPARDLPGMLANCGQALPGPRPGTVWVQNDDQQHPRMVLVGLDGRPTGVFVPSPAYPVLADGAGQVLVVSVGGTYDAGPSGLHRVTTGTVLAAGPSGWLAEECDHSHNCTLDVIDRRSGAHRPIGASRDDQYTGGVISPDGTLAALTTQTDQQNQGAVLHLIDLRSGVDRTTRITVSGDQDPRDGGAMAWSPDSRWLFAVNAAGSIIAVNRAGHPRTLDTGLPAIGQLAMR